MKYQKDISQDYHRSSPHPLLQSVMGVHSIFHILHHHEPKHPTELSNHNSINSSHVKSFTTHQPRLNSPPPNHNSMSSRHVEPLFDIRIDLLPAIVVTFATFHLLRFPLKAEDERNTVARKDGRVHSKTTQEEKPEEEP